MQPLSEPNLPAALKKVFQGAIFSVWQWPQVLYDGSLATFELVRRPDTAYMLPVMDDGRILLVKDQQPHREEVVTMPRGRVEKDEPPQAAAIRECSEETGFLPTRVMHWNSYYPHGKHMWQVHFFVGRDLQKTTGPKLDAGEKISLMPVSFEDFIDMGARGELQDLKLQTIILTAQLYPEKMQELKTLLYE